jgi:hypothetical protein
VYIIHQTIREKVVVPLTVLHYSEVTHSTAQKYGQWTSNGMARSELIKLKVISPPFTDDAREEG